MFCYLKKTNFECQKCIEILHNMRFLIFISIRKKNFHFSTLLCKDTCYVIFIEWSKFPHNQVHFSTNFGMPLEIKYTFEMNLFSYSLWGQWIKSRVNNCWVYPKHKLPKKFTFLSKLPQWIYNQAYFNENKFHLVTISIWIYHWYTFSNMSLALIDVGASGIGGLQPPSPISDIFYVNLGKIT